MRNLPREMLAQWNIYPVKCGAYFSWAKSIPSEPSLFIWGVPDVPCTCNIVSPCSCYVCLKKSSFCHPKHRYWPNVRPVLFIIAHNFGFLACPTPLHAIRGENLNRCSVSDNNSKMEHLLMTYRWLYCYVVHGRSQTLEYRNDYYQRL